MCGVLGFYGGAHTLFAAYAKFGPVVGCGDVVPSYQAVLSRFRCFSLVGSSSKLQLRTCEACGVVGRKTVTVGDETRGMHYLTWTSWWSHHASSWGNKCAAWWCKTEAYSAIGKARPYQWWQIGKNMLPTLVILILREQSRALMSWEAERISQHLNKLHLVKTKTMFAESVTAWALALAGVECQ